MNTVRVQPRRSIIHWDWGKRPMELSKTLRAAFLPAACIYFVAAMAVFSMAAVRPSAKSHKVKITGPIILREANMLQIMNEKDGSVYGFKVTDKTIIRSHNGFLHHDTAMDASVLVPSLTVEVEGISTSQSTPEAKTIKFDPDTLAPTENQDAHRRNPALLLRWICQLYPG
jgi:hypothetical protein